MHMSWWVFFPNRRYKLEGTSCRCRWGSSHDISLNCSQTTHRRFARTENAMMPCISSHQIRSSVPGFHSDGLLIWSYKYLRNIISPCFQPRGQRCVTKVKVLLYTLDAKAAEGSCSSIVTVPDISGEAWVAHLPDKTLRNNRDSSGETNQKKKDNIKSVKWACLVPVWCSRLSLRIHIEVESFVSKKYQEILRKSWVSSPYPTQTCFAKRRQHGTAPKETFCRIVLQHVVQMSSVRSWSPLNSLGGICTEFKTKKTLVAPLVYLPIRFYFPCSKQNYTVFWPQLLHVCPKKGVG